MDQFVFEVLVIFVESLGLAHSDEPSMGNCYSAVTIIVSFIVWLYFFFLKPLMLSKTRFQKSTLKAVVVTLLSLGTLQQCGSAIDHLKRIIKQKAPSLNQQSAKRRIPRFVLPYFSFFFFQGTYC